jgi:hypothetical protein
LADLPGTSRQAVGDKPSVATITQSLKTLKIPSRRNQNKCGTKGRPIIVETNHLALDLTRLRNNIVIHYDVELNPAVPKRLFRCVRLFFNCLQYCSLFVK